MREVSSRSVAIFEKGIQSTGAIIYFSTAYLTIIDWRDIERRKNWLPLSIQTSTSTPTVPAQTAHEFVPYFPSQFVDDMLSAVVNHAGCAGSHLLDPAIVALLKRTLLCAVLDRIHAFLDGIPKLSQGDTDTSKLSASEGIIQLWFDVKFLSALLSFSPAFPKLLIHAIQKYSLQEMQPIPSVENTATDGGLAEIVEWSKKGEVVLQRIKSLLDPLDVLFYQKPMQTQFQQTLERTTLLYASLLPSTNVSEEAHGENQRKRHKDITPQVSIALRTDVPRFKLLPVADSTNNGVHNPSLSSYSHNSTESGIHVVFYW